MRKYFILTALFAGVCLICVSAQTVKNEDVRSVAVTKNVDSISKQLLKELETIRGLQQEAREQRMKAVRYRDSLNKTSSIASNSSEYSVMSDVELNTRFDFWANGFNFWALFTLIVSGCATGYTIATYNKQKQTELHTTNAPISVQQWKLEDLPRHFYRNIVCTCALILKYRDEGDEKKRKRYPSESNLKKLQTLPDDVFLPIDINKNRTPEENPYKYMHELKLLFRNYNVEVDVASEHLSRKNIDDKTIEQDFDNLLFKPINLIRKTFDYEKRLPGAIRNTNTLVARTICNILQEHFKKLSECSNFNLLLESKAKNNLDKMLSNKCGEFKKLVDSKDGIERSVDLLLKQGVGKEKMQGVSVEKVKDDSFHCYNKNEGQYNKENEAFITRTEAIKYFEELKGTFLCGEKDEKTGKITCPGIMCIHNENQFVDFYNGFISTIVDEEKMESIKELYKYIKPYLDYLNSETWEFHTLLKYIIAIDASIEYDRIGMVNYE